MAPRPRRSFTPAFKAETVQLVRTSGKSISQLCRDLDLTETAVRRWVAQAQIDRGERAGLTTSEREELSRLRREIRVLLEEVEAIENLPDLVKVPGVDVPFIGSGDLSQSMGLTGQQDHPEVQNLTERGGKPITEAGRIAGCSCPQPADAQAPQTRRAVLPQHSWPLASTR